MCRLRPLAAWLVLILTSSAGAQPAADMWANARPLTLRLSSFKFEPADVMLEHGVPYDLHLVNGSSGGHDFAARDFLAAAQIMPADRAKVRGGRVEVGGGESVEVHLIAPSPGSYKLRCTHFMHSAFGMTGRIVVQ